MADHVPITTSPDPDLNELMTERRAFWSSFTGITKYAVIVIVLLVVALYVFFG